MNGCHVALIGKVTKPGELRYSQNGTAMLRVGLLIQDSKRAEDDPPEFANITLWGELGERLQDALPKGAELYVEGRAKARAWAGQDGQPRASLDVSAWRAEVLGQIGRQRRRQDEDLPRRQDNDGPRRMPAMMGPVGARALAEDGLEPLPF